MWFPVISLRLIKALNVANCFFPHLVNTWSDKVDCTGSEMCDHSCLCSAFHICFFCWSILQITCLSSNLVQEKHLSVLHFVKKRNTNKNKRLKKIRGWFSIQKKKSSDIQYVEVLHRYCKLSSSVIGTGYQSIKVRTVIILMSWIILLNWKHRCHTSFVGLNYLRS